MSTSGAKRLEWKPRALRELSDSFDYIAAEDPQVIPRTPFLIIYRVRARSLVIGRVLHHARRYT